MAHTPRPPSHETMSALLAAHTAIRVARDLGYPKIEVPPPSEPAVPEDMPRDYDPDAPPLIEPPRQISAGEMLYITLTVLALILLAVLIIVAVQLLMLS